MNSYIQPERMIAEFMELSAIDSVSFKERRMADVLKEKLKGLGVSVYEDDAAVHYGSEAGNLYGYLKGTLPGDPILFSSHMDTVEPGIGKKAVLQEDGRITSDGTSVLGADDVTGIVAILEAVRCIQEYSIPHRDIELLFPIAEEAYVQGSSVFDYGKFRAKEAYVMDLSGAIGTASLREPTLISFQITVQGKAAHAGFSPELGIHAIAVAADAVNRVRQGRIGDDTTVNIGKISGGVATNVVPDQVVLEGEVRSYSHETALSRMEDICRIFEEAANNAGASCDVQSRIHLYAYQVSENEPVVQHFLKVCEDLHIKTELISTFGGSDNNCFLRHGIRGIVIACGMHQVHTVNEYTYPGEMAQCASILLGLMTEEDQEQ